MPTNLQNVDLGRKRKVYSLRPDLAEPESHNVDMSSDQPKNHLRAWREFREMTQEQLGERIGTTKAVISAIERGERGLSSKWLMKLAPALDTEPGHLLKHDPAAVPMDILDVWRNVPDDRKPEALEMLQIFNKKRA